ncbi:MAG: hypothetical protein IIZ34_05520 [Eubacterium sp.]|jgi:hypothetical protein|nr:hypothetical protein [Eubacterium sp.]
MAAKKHNATRWVMVLDPNRFDIYGAYLEARNFSVTLPQAQEMGRDDIVYIAVLGGEGLLRYKCLVTAVHTQESEVDLEFLYRYDRVEISLKELVEAGLPRGKALSRISGKVQNTVERWESVDKTMASVSGQVAPDLPRDHWSLDRPALLEYGWEITTDRCVTLYTEESFLLEEDALMPEEVEPFFGVKEQNYGVIRQIWILCEDQLYSAEIAREKKRARITWGEELAAALAERYNEFGPCENAKFYIMPRPMLEHILGGRPLPNEDVYYMVIDGE